jgi:hypothetical protein
MIAVDHKYAAPGGSWRSLLALLASIALGTGPAGLAWAQDNPCPPGFHREGGHLTGGLVVGGHCVKNMPPVAPTIFVDGQNAGAQDGTAAHPYQTVPQALAVAAAGDTIEIQTGFYHSNTLVFDKAGLVRAENGTVTITTGNCAPTINSLSVVGAVNQAIDIAYDMRVPSICKLASAFIPLDPKTGRAYSGYIVFNPDPSGKGTVGVTVVWPRPLDMRFEFSCGTANECSSAGDVLISAPPQPKITLFTTNPEDGSPHFGRQCYGLKQSFQWSVSLPNTLCTKHEIRLSATDDDHQGAQFFVSKNLAPSGSVAHIANTNAHYTLTATCLDDQQSDSKQIPVSIALASQCAGSGTKPSQGQTFCFKAVGKASQICSTDAIYQDTKQHAQNEFEQQFPPSEYDESSISCSQVITACPDLTKGPPCRRGRPHFLATAKKRPTEPSVPLIRHDVTGWGV